MIGIDEAHRIPFYIRIHANYDCGCTVYSDDWTTETLVPKHCGKHNNALLYGTAETKQKGVRPDKLTGIHYSTVKLPKNA